MSMCDEHSTTGNTIPLYTSSVVQNVRYTLSVTSS